MATKKSQAVKAATADRPCMISVNQNELLLLGLWFLGTEPTVPVRTRVESLNRLGLRVVQEMRKVGREHKAVARG